MEAEAGGPWTEEEVRTLLAVWTDQNVEQGLRGGGGQDRAVFTSVSSRLQALGVARSWRQCCTKYRSLRQQPSTTSHTMAFYQDPAAILVPEEGAGLSQEAGRANQEERCRIKPALGPGTRVELEVGKHWADEEVRALLHTWAERREELRGAARNKSIFQEMSRRLQRMGVERSWKQCRTKYKNLKYDYKSARSTPGPDGPPKSMKFYCEVEALVLGIDPQGLWRGPERDQPTPSNKGERGPLDRRSGAGGADVGRNWQEEEVRALVSIWAEEPVKQQLENATRNRDIFLHISQRLHQLGVERDWKQCRTKYKNLKYVYRSLQRAPPDPALPGHAHPGPAMSFYREVDAILRKASIEQAPPTQLHRTGHRSTPVICTEEADSGTDETFEQRGVKRERGEASEEEWSVPSKRDLHRLDTEEQSVNSSVPDTMDFHCKEEPGQYIPILQIHSVCSMDSSGTMTYRPVSQTAVYARHNDRVWASSVFFKDKKNKNLFTMLPAVSKK